MKLVFTKSDLAKYPFLPEAAEYIKLLDLKIDNLANPELRPLLERAENRIEESLLNNPPEVSYRPREEDIEIPSFPVAVMMVAASANDFIKRRFALAEARRVYNLLRLEDKKTVMEIAVLFNWKIRTVEEKVGSRNYDFALHFMNFLKNTMFFHENKWKLVNRFLKGGEVYLTKQEAARLLQEEVRRRIEKRLEVDIRSMLPQNVSDRIERLRRIYASRVGKVRFDELPKDAVDAAFPPCIRQLRQAAASGRHLSHVGRFALTSFLLRIGLSPARVVDLFRTSSDFNERMTRYQVEHIAGSRGSRTKYMPPNCDNLRTHGICPGTDEICLSIRHPLAYYRKKLRMLKTVITADQV